MKISVIGAGNIGGTLYAAVGRTAEDGERLAGVGVVPRPLPRP